MVFGEAEEVAHDEPRVLGRAGHFDMKLRRINRIIPQSHTLDFGLRPLPCGGDPLPALRRAFDLAAVTFHELELRGQSREGGVLAQLRDPVRAAFKHAAGIIATRARRGVPEVGIQRRLP